MKWSRYLLPLLVWAAVQGSPIHATAQEQAEPEEQREADEKVPVSEKDEQAAQQSTTAATSLTQQIQGDSGISIQTLCTNCNNADLSLGGLGNEHVDVVCDGLPVAQGLGQIYLLSIMPSTMIDKVAVRKGAGEVQLDGGAVGGGIEIERREPRPGVQLNVSGDAGSYGWMGSKLDLSGRRGRFGGAFIGSLAQSDRIDANGDGNPDLGSIDRHTLEGAAEVELPREQRLRLGLASYIESQKDGPGGADPQQGNYDLENVELDRSQYDLGFETLLGLEPACFQASS